MSTGRRISITVSSGVGLAIVAVGLERSEALVHPNSWLVAFFVACGLAVVGAFVVYRWWAVVPSLTTVITFYWAAYVGSQNPTSFGEFLGSEYAVPLFFLPIAIGIAALSAGLLARAIWEHLIRPTWSSVTNWEER